MTATNNKIKIRATDAEYFIRKEEESGKTFIDFYAAVFNQKSKLIREYGEVFYEIIGPLAFVGVLKNPELNTIATVNHNRAQMLGRVKSGTLTMITDARGLKCTLEIPDTTTGRDLVVMIERGDYFECSFIFTIEEGGLIYDRAPEIAVRTVTNIAALIDVSIVIDGAYANTEIKKRYLNEPGEAEIETSEKNPNDILIKQIELLKIKK